MILQEGNINTFTITEILFRLMRCPDIKWHRVYSIFTDTGIYNIYSIYKYNLEES